MLNRKGSALQVDPTLSWQQELARAIADPLELLEILGLAGHPVYRQCERQSGFRMRVPWPWISRIRHADADDPLLRQVLPLDLEGEVVAGYSLDPVADGAAQIAPGVLQKYHGRALIIATGACAVHCRYCFRRHFPYADANAATGQWRPALNAIRADPSIREVIVSGGDPLSLQDSRFAELVAGIEDISRVRRLRIHTRLPVVIPQRVTQALLHTLTASRLQTVMVLHINHASEIDEQVAGALRLLGDAGITLLNQSVLLAGVNDAADVLIALSEALFASGVLPYYLHQLDPVAGAAHFAVSDELAHELHAAMRERLPGYLLPSLVREIPGQPSKTPL